MRQSVLLTVASLGMALSAQALVVTHESFDSNFNAYEQLPATWQMHGIEGVPTGNYDYLFSNYTPEQPYTLLTLDGKQVAFTPMGFANEAKSDQWLITPEFEITADSELLYFTAYASGTTLRCNYEVRLSEGGTEVEDFSTELLATALQGQLQSINNATRRVVVNGHAGKKVRLAFVAKGNTAGIMGFSDIGVAPYYMKIDDPEGLETMVIDADNPTLTFKAKVATTSKISGLTAILECGNGFEADYEFEGNLSQSMFTTVAPVFHDIDFKGLDQMPYKVRLRPNDPKLPETLIEGMLVKARRIYPNNIVSEEGTGTWCGYCPYGMGIMEYYADKYDGGEGRSKFIPVAVHSGDPMQPTDEYLMGWQNAAIKYMPSLGYPCIMANRATTEHPVSIDIDAMAATKAFANLYVSRVDMDETDWKVNVRFRPRVSFDSEDFTFNASVILVENGLRGTSSQWAQTNNLNVLTPEAVATQLGEDMLPYFERFINRPTGTIPASEMVYNDVARAAYPSFQGMRMTGAWQADTFRDEEISFVLPNSVTNPERIAVVVVMTDPATGQIVASDIVQAADFGKELSGVESVIASAEGIHLYRSGEVVVADVVESGRAEVYTIDGRRIATVTLAAGRNEVSLPEGMAVVKVTTHSGTASIKTVR